MLCLHQKLQPFPQDWFSQGHFIAAPHEVRSSLQTPASSQPAVEEDDRTGSVYIHGRGTVMTYMFEVRREPFPSRPSLPVVLLTQRALCVPGAGEHLQVLGPAVRRVVAAAAAVGGRRGVRQSSGPTSHGEEDAQEEHVSPFWQRDQLHKDTFGSVGRSPDMSVSRSESRRYNLCVFVLCSSPPCQVWWTRRRSLQLSDSVTTTPRRSSLSTSPCSEKSSCRLLPVEITTTLTSTPSGLETNTSDVKTAVTTWGSSGGLSGIWTKV